jgi:hypothetical protein
MANLNILCGWFSPGNPTLDSISWDIFTPLIAVLFFLSVTEWNLKYSPVINTFGSLALGNYLITINGWGPFGGLIPNKPTSAYTEVLSSEPSFLSFLTPFAITILVFLFCSTIEYIRQKIFMALPFHNYII